MDPHVGIANHPHGHENKHCAESIKECWSPVWLRICRRTQEFWESFDKTWIAQAPEVAFIFSRLARACERIVQLLHSFPSSATESNWLASGDCYTPTQAMQHCPWLFLSVSLLLFNYSFSGRSLKNSVPPSSSEMGIILLTASFLRREYNKYTSIY